MWDLILLPVLRHPWIATGASLLALAVLALPARSIHTALPGVADMSKSIPSVAAFDKANAVFPGTQVPLVLVIRAKNVEVAPVRRAVAELGRKAVATGLMVGPVTVAVSPTHTVERVSLPVRGNGEDATSTRALSVLRSTLIPRTIGRLPNVDHAVTGDTAGNADFNQSVKHHFPYVFAFVLGLAFLLLLVTFRSIVIPLTAIALNLLSVAAAYGVLVWIFQDGHLQLSTISLERGGRDVAAAVSVRDPLRALDGLPRVHRQPDQGARRRGMSNADAVATGIRTTAGRSPRLPR